MGGNAIAYDAPGELSNTDMTEEGERQVLVEEEARLQIRRSPEDGWRSVVSLFNPEFYILILEAVHGCVS